MGSLGSFHISLLDYKSFQDLRTLRRNKDLEVKIYTKPGCPYCAMAREYYNARGIAFQEFNAQDNLAFRAEMLAISNGDPTVPVIVEDGRLKQIGWEGRG